MNPKTFTILMVIFMYLFITGCSFLIEQQIAFGDIQDKDITYVKSEK